MTTVHARRSDARSDNGFTLIELLVVIAIIALLIGILLPALGAARGSAQALKAGANARNISQGVSVYGSVNRDFVPPAYTYPSTPTGLAWSMQDQGFTVDSGVENNGYAHWSYFLYDGAVPEDAFESPKTTNNGAPRTYDDPNDPNDQEEWQADNPTLITDRQVPRIAFTVNAAIMPRNKFNARDEGKPRENVLVSVDRIRGASNTILATEMEDIAEWRSVSDATNIDDAGVESKAHRPLVPFVPFGGEGLSVYDAGNVNYPRRAFQYRRTNEIWDDERLQREGVGLITDDGKNINLVSRAHKGRSNFSFVDGHVELLTLEETMEDAMWGDRFYSLTPALDQFGSSGSQNTAVFTRQELEQLGIDG